MSETSEALARFAALHPTSLALLTPTAQLTYSQLAIAVDESADFLRRAGLAAGQRIVTALPSDAAFVIVRLASERLGAVLTPLDPRSGTLRLAVEETQAALFIVADPRDADTLLATGPYRSCDDAGRPSILTSLHVARRTNPAETVAPPELRLVLFTSGSTGRPKGVMMACATVDGIARIGREVLGIAPSDRIATLAPLSHFYSMREIDTALGAGATLIVAPFGAFPVSALSLVQNAKASGLVMVPSMLERFLKGRTRGLFLDVAARLRFLALGTAHVSRELRADLARALPEVEVLLTYGLTECSRVACGLLRETPDDSVGQPAPGVAIEIRSEAGVVCFPGQSGRVHVQSPLMMAGYWSRDGGVPLTRGANGFYATADRGRRDADGFLFLEGRLDDVIDVGGFRVSLTEIEHALAAHPDVKEAAAAPARLADGVGEAACAAVVLTPGATSSADDLMRHAGPALDAAARPRRILIVSALPRTGMGKVDRAAVRTLLER